MTTDSSPPVPAASLADSNATNVAAPTGGMAAILAHDFTATYPAPYPKLQISTDNGLRVVATAEHPRPFSNALAVDADAAAYPALVLLAAEELAGSLIGLTPGDDGPLLAEKLAMRAATAGQTDGYDLVGRLNRTGNAFGRLHPDDARLSFAALAAGASAGDRACAARFAHNAHYMLPGTLPPDEADATQAKAARVLDELLAGGAPDAELAFLKAQMLRDGTGYEKDYAAARRFVQIAADAGSAEAELELYRYPHGVGGPKDEAASLRHLVAGAHKGESTAMYILAEAYAERSEGVQKDHALSIEWYRKSADAGFEPAAEELAQMYRTGEGAPLDLALADKYEKMAEELSYM
ncbi:Secretory immunoglobulin A-binding protein EsiB [Vanrija pseudolonga]|uniref:Secretory immunoglobulin A-binding protein EsiB n=1 Tax=Vanrija pseudolonga TaxID=143232 RepID=A0AAF0YKS6_9TREE|nr:Secretory immunoglobulin A-binding protein EsiB [Vanrija pseudolonga]